MCKNIVYKTVLNCHYCQQRHLTHSNWFHECFIVCNSLFWPFHCSMFSLIYVTFNTKQHKTAITAFPISWMEFYLDTFLVIARRPKNPRWNIHRGHNPWLFFFIEPCQWSAYKASQQVLPPPVFTVSSLVFHVRNIPESPPDAFCPQAQYVNSDICYLWCSDYVKRYPP